MKKALFFMAAAAAGVVLGDGLAPLNPAFEKWRLERNSASRRAQGGSTSARAASGARRKGLVPSTVDFSYLSRFYVNGRADSPLKPAETRPRAMASQLPTAYDSRKDGKGLTSVKNQNPHGTCWAHATCGCLEAGLLKSGKGEYDFSENNMANLHGGDWTFAEGGNFHLSSAYLLRWDGPVLEAYDPYPNVGGSPRNLEPAFHVQNVKWIPARSSASDNAVIKRAVMEYGAVYASYYHQVNENDEVDLGVKNAYWNPEEGAYYRSRYEHSNHAICIVGWDDGYSAGNFSTRPPGDGAFLIKNSWGTDFGRSGYRGFCWISYYDAGLAGQDGGDGYETSCVFASAEPVGNYSDIYQYDTLGAVNFYGDLGGTVSAAAMFVAREDLVPSAVGVYLPEPYAKYDIAIYSDCSAGQPTSGRKIGSASGTAGEFAGFQTIPVNVDGSVSKGARLSAVVAITTASERQIAIEYPLYNFSSQATANSGETFVLENGWTDFTALISKASFCCKVYTKRHVASSGTYTVKFAANGGTGTMADRTYSYGKSYTLPANAFTRDGYAFSGWKWSGGQFADCGEISFSSAVSSPLTLTAQWQKVAVSSPSAPVISEVTRGDLDRISVTWTAVPGAKRYNLYWCAIEEFPSTQKPISVSGTAYLDTERMPGLEIYYWVSAVNDAGESAVSAPKSGYRAATCSVSPVSASIPADGSAGETVVVSANTSWRVLSSDSWINVKDGIGPKGTATFSYSVDANSSTKSRSGSITVGTSAVDHRVTRTITVFQAGSSRPLPGVPEVNKALYTSSGFYISWTAASDASTYKIYRSSNPDYFGTGETCIASGLKGTSYTDSTANWLFAYDYRVVAVNDAGETSGPVVTLQGSLSGSAVVIPSITSGTFPAAGGRASFAVDLIGADKWEASSSAEWLALSATAGSAGGDLVVTAAKNTTSSRRTATVLIGAGSKIGGVWLSSATVTFTQDAGDGSGGSGGGGAQADLTLPARGGMDYGYVKTPAGEKWEFLLSNKPSWITGINLGGSDVTGNSSFSVSSDTAHTWSIGFTVSENTGAVREWTIPIMRGGALIGSLVVRQRAAGDDGGNDEPPEDDSDVIPAAGGTKTYNVSYTANEEWKFDISKRPAWVTKFVIDGDEYSMSHISFSRKSTSGGVIVISATASSNSGSERRWSIPITSGSASRGSLDIVQAGNGGGSSGGGSSGGGSSGGGSSGGGSSGGDAPGGGYPLPSVLKFGPGEGSIFSVPSYGKAVVVGVSSLTWAKFAKRAYHGEQSEKDRSKYSFYTFDDSRIVDAEKNSKKEDFDDCWCSALSMMDLFFWGGWITGYADEDAVKNYMQKQSAAAGDDTGGWEFFDLVSPDYSDDVHMGFVEDLSQFTAAFKGADRLFGLTVDFDENYIWKGMGGVSHDVACCGYSLADGKSASDPSALTGLFIIDSDSDMYNGSGGASAPDSITYCPVRWEATEGLYEIDNVFGAKGTFTLESMYYIRAKNSPAVNFTEAPGNNGDDDDHVKYEPGASGTVTKKAASGKPVTLTAKPGKNSVLAYWTVNGEKVGFASAFTYVPDGNTVPVAVFRLKSTVEDPVLERDAVEPSANAMVGVAFKAFVPISDAAYPAKFTASGLPAGLKIDGASGVISGVPKKAGNYTPTITVAGGASAKAKSSISIPITIRPLPAWAQGTFTGFSGLLEQEDGDDVVVEYGSASLAVSAAGKVSGKVSLCGTNWTFSAASYDAASETDDEGTETFRVRAEMKSGKLTMPLALSVRAAASPEDAGSSLLNAVAEDDFDAGNAITLFACRGMWKDKATAAAAKSAAAALEGVYTLSLSADEDFGSGYLSITVGKDGNVKATGKLADGTGVSASSPLMYGDYEGDGCYFVFLYASPGAYKGGSFALSASFFSESPGSMILENAIGVSQWTSRSFEATGEYGEGFSRSLDFVGAYYDKLANLRKYYDSLKFEFNGAPELAYMCKSTYLDENDRKRTESWLEMAEAADTSSQSGLTVQVDGNGALSVVKATKPVQSGETKEWTYNGANDGALSLSFAQATGIFKGSYTFWYDYVSAYDEIKDKETMAHTSKKVNFEGIMVQGESELRGFYLWDAIGVYEDAKTGREKTYKYRQSCPVRLCSPDDE